MTVIDWIIVAVLIVSSLISIKRGFAKEAMSLASWLIALIVARLFSDNLASLLTSWLANEAHRYTVAFVILFIATLIVGSLINHLLGEFIKITGLSGTDRALGTVFGLLRGIVIVVAMLALGQLFALDQFWQDSTLVPYFEPVIRWVGENLHKASDAILSVGGE
ncbi:CvpA family protein [Reinekea marinisedimentorum]|uniref:Membrane protein required for colicin V production n=1 Tax=Reinekea marinisedimentorum TaxID=230495 RepID=A0A4R3I5Z5_9GAMM|nr:CvpA family protein [Reinekea marinisedimentorum]TCS41447.1 membrane protein required for colicin V production [Reinekea marinisedimentorum]